MTPNSARYECARCRRWLRGWRLVRILRPGQVLQYACRRCIRERNATPPDTQPRRA